MGKNIVLVDDALFMRTMMKGILERYGYHVVGEGANGREGVEKYKLLRPDILLMDITMPEMDGLTALRHIMEFNPQAVVVMISAMGQKEYVLDAIKSGAKNFIVKPFQEEKIIEVLKAL